MRPQSDGTKKIAPDNVMPFVGRPSARRAPPREPAQIIQLYPQARGRKEWRAVGYYALIIAAMLFYATVFVITRGLGCGTSETAFPPWLWS